MKSVSYQDYLIESLKDPTEAAGYLTAALEGGDIGVFLLALQNVIKAGGGIATLVKNSTKSRTSLYKALSKTGNPHLRHMNDILLTMDMHFAVASCKPHSHYKKAARLHSH